MKNKPISIDQAATILPLDKLIAELEESYRHSTKGGWTKGNTTHHTVTKTNYPIAEFHHASDAQFCDVAHGFMPRIIAELTKLNKLTGSGDTNQNTG